MTEPARCWPGLLGHGVLAALGLAAAAAATDSGLRAREHARAMAQLAGVLPAALYDNDPVRDRVELQDAAAFGTDAAMPVQRARLRGQPSAVVVEAVAAGYGGDLRLRIGIAADGRVLGVRVIDHRETRGLGDAFEHDGGQWLRGFSGRSLHAPSADAWRVRRDGGAFDQFSGATQTPRAIVARVHAVLAAYADHGERWFGDGATAP